MQNRVISANICATRMFTTQWKVLLSRATMLLSRLLMLLAVQVNDRTFCGCTIRRDKETGREEHEQWLPLGKESDDVYEIGQKSRVTKLFSVTSKESVFSFKK